MVQSCKEQQEKVEESVLQPIDQWVQQQEQRCRNEPCNWWTLCLNKVFCWIVWAAVKIVVWTMMVVVRWVYRTVCTVVSIVVGLVALVFGRVDILQQGISDLWELAKDGFYTGAGLVIYGALSIVDGVQSVLGLQSPKRALTEQERSTLWPIFRNSLNYRAISVVAGTAGLLGVSGQAYTIGFTIYMPTYAMDTLVHECVHVWQFEFGGTSYIGRSAFTQLDSILFSKGYDPYEWEGPLHAAHSWYSLNSVEAQARFVQDVFLDGEFVFRDPVVPADTAHGAFFPDPDEMGHNEFAHNGTPYTSVANDAWRILRTG